MFTKNQYKYRLAPIVVEILFINCHGFKPVAINKKIETESGKMDCWYIPNDSLQITFTVGFKPDRLLKPARFRNKKTPN